MKMFKKKNFGASRELNPGPPVPKTGIIPLDYSPKPFIFKFKILYIIY